MAENRTNKDEEILRLTNTPDFIKNMTPEEYEQFKKDAAERIKEKKSIEKIKKCSSGNITRLYRILRLVKVSRA